jgi:glutamyl-tRNA(Gln) amidotransferase subunit E
VDPALLAATDLSANVTRLMACCGYRPIEESLVAGNAVRAVRLPGFAGLLARPTQPNTCFAQELSERARVIACLTGRPFMLSHDVAGHRDLLLSNIWPEVRAAVRADAEDSVVIVWGEARDLRTAASEILLRAEEAFVGVPPETRQAHADGTTGFERILPGPERMYPDTDTPPLPIPDVWVPEMEITQGRWEMPWSRVDRYVAAGLSIPAANRLAAATWADLFDALAPKQPATARRLAAALEKRLPCYWREAGGRDLPSEERLRPLVEALDAGAVYACGTEAVLDRLLRETDASATSIVDEHRCADGSELLGRIQEISKQTACVAGRSSQTVLRWGMGMLLRGFPRGRFDPLAARSQLVVALQAVEVKVS